MREPDFDTDGWCLDDGEERHAGAPDTFWIPDLASRENLKAGDVVQLIFRIAVRDDDDPVAIERMWVIVREQIPGGYLGILDNDPFSIEENQEFWSGIELPFSAYHVIDIMPRNDKTVARAKEIPRRRWVD